MGVINFTFILVDKMSLFWIFSGCDVKPHLEKAGPFGPRQCLPALRLNTLPPLFMVLLGWDRNTVTHKNKIKIYIYCGDSLGSEDRQPHGMR